MNSGGLWVRDAGGARYLRGKKLDPVYGNVDETDEETIARGEREAKRNADDAAFAASEAGQLKARQAKVMGMDPTQMRAGDTWLANAVIAWSDALDRVKAAEAPIEAAKADASKARAALPLHATAGMLPSASLDEIKAAQAAFKVACEDADALDERVKLLQSSVDPALYAELRKASDEMDRVREARRQGVQPPRAYVPYFLGEEEKNLLAHLLQVSPDARSSVYTAVAFKSGSKGIPWRGLFRLAGLSIVGREDLIAADAGFQPSEHQDCEDCQVQRRIGEALRGTLAFRFSLDPAKGAAIRKLDKDWYPRPARLGIQGV